MTYDQIKNTIQYSIYMHFFSTYATRGGTAITIQFESPECEESDFHIKLFSLRVFLRIIKMANCKYLSPYTRVEGEFFHTQYTTTQRGRKAVSSNVKFLRVYSFMLCIFQLSNMSRAVWVSAKTSNCPSEENRRVSCAKGLQI